MARSEAVDGVLGISARQSASWAILRGGPVVARVCPYCLHKVAYAFAGYHAPERVKCASCGEEVILPAVSVRRRVEGPASAR